MSNHLLVGTIIGLTVKEPLLVLPLAFVSHFVIDSLPHFGYGGAGYDEMFKHKATYVMEIFGILGVVLLLMTGVYGWNIALAGALAALAADIEWPFRYWFFERKGKKPPKTFLTDFHKKVQWQERSWGIIPEILFFAGGFIILLNLIN